MLALGQGAVILTGGLDLSVPWTIGFCGILLAGMVKGSDAALVYALPLALGVGAAIGFVNGAGVVLLGVSPIVMTLAINGILQGAALHLFQRHAGRVFLAAAAPVHDRPRVAASRRSSFSSRCSSSVAVLLLGKTPFGRRIYADRQRRARGGALRRAGRVATLIGVYMLSASARHRRRAAHRLFGQASLGMGDEYLLPSIAVVVIGGALITGGRGHYLGMLGGALLLTALQTLLAGTTLPYATRTIVFGLVVLGGGDGAARAAS